MSSLITLIKQYSAIPQMTQLIVILNIYYKYYDKNKPTSGQRSVTVDRSWANSTAASSTVLLAVRSLLGAMTQTASGDLGKVAWITSALSWAAQAPGVDMTPKENSPLGISTMRSAMLRRCESPMRRTNWNKGRIFFLEWKSIILCQFKHFVQTLNKPCHRDAHPTSKTCAVCQWQQKSPSVSPCGASRYHLLINTQNTHKPW